MASKLVLTLVVAMMTNVLCAGEKLDFSLRVKGIGVEVTHGKVSYVFNGNFVVFKTTADPQMELRALTDTKYFAPSWVAENLAEGKGIAEIKRAKDTGGDGIDNSVAGSVKNRTFDIFASAPYVAFTPVSCKAYGDTIRFTYQPSAVGTFECKIYSVTGTAPVVDYEFRPADEAYYSVGYLGAAAYTVDQIDALWQPMVWQRKIFPTRSYMSLAYMCPVPATLINRSGITMGVVADPEEIPFQPLPTQYNNRFGVAVRNAKGEVQPMIFAPVLGHVNSKMKQGDSFSFRFHLWVESAPVNRTFQTIARNLFDFHDYRRNEGVCNINTTIDNIIDYSLSVHSNFIDSLKGCSYSTDVPGSTKNVSSLNPLSVALIADDAEVYERRAYPIMEYMLSRENTLFCLDTTMKVQSPSRKMSGPCAVTSELAELYKLSNGASGVFRYMAEEKFYGGKPVGQRTKMSGKWYDALELYRATGDENYLKYAKEGADKYVESYINTQQTAFQNAFFWNRFAPFYINLLELYEVTGEKRYLDAAHEGAREYAMFVWMCPVIPDDMITVNKGGLAPYYWYLKSKGMPQQKFPEEIVPAWRLSEIGLLPESATTSIGHRAVFMAHHAPYMMRIANYTGDAFMHDIARSAIVGRYQNFPGYHINTERTTAYEKKDYPLRPHNEISVNSFHYNHQFPLLSVLYDYAITDAVMRSENQIMFNGDYIEGYGYLQAKFYGNTSGKFYDRENVWLWMPRRLLSIDNVELNYIAARGENEIMVAFTNQCKENVVSQVRFNLDILPQMKGQKYIAELWRENKKTGEIVVENGVVAGIQVDAEGVTAIIVKGIDVNTKFQHRILGKQNSSWKNDYYQSTFGGARAMILNMGADLKTAFVYLQNDDSKFKSVSMAYSIDGAKFKSMNDTSYPFEFTVPLNENSQKIIIKLTGVNVDGKLLESEVFMLSKE